jgi:putative oxidoreductase
MIAGQAWCCTRVAAVGIFGLFVGMIVFIHRPNGFFMNWFGKLPAGMEGFEYHLLVLGLCVAIFMEGGGKFSVDRLYFE